MEQTAQILPAVGKYHLSFPASSESPRDSVLALLVVSPKWLALSQAVSARWSLSASASNGVVAPIVPIAESDTVEGLPRKLVELYADLAIEDAQVAEVDPGVWFAEVPGIDGAWGEGSTPTIAVQDLREAIVGWVAVKRLISARDIPVLHGIDLNRAASE
jgi:predicted RNase H-like HicB family nuclease